MSNKSRKNKSSQSPKQEPIEQVEYKDAAIDVQNENEAGEDAIDNVTPKKLGAIQATPPDTRGPNKDIQLQNQIIAFENISKEVRDLIEHTVISLKTIADKLNQHTIFGITAARFQTFANKIKKYPKQLENKAARERRRLTQTETKEEKKEKKSKALREKIQDLQTKLAKL